MLAKNKVNFSIDDLKKWYTEHQHQLEKDYFTFLKIPSISTDPIYRDAVYQAALWVEAYLKDSGFQTQRWPTDLHPIVYASRQIDPSYPTILIYHHYDVQPVDPLDKWISPPFNPQVRNGIVYARGASDNKGQCFATLAALRSVFSLQPNFPINIKVFVEGEEECGSFNTLQTLRSKKDFLKAEYLFVVDSGFISLTRPAITLGLRGIVTLDVTCRTSTVDLHSGIHGGIALNPNRVLISILSQLWDTKGHIQIPGFYDDVMALPEIQKEAIDREIDEHHLRQQFGIKAFHYEEGYTLWETGNIRPTLEINGISGGYTGNGFKTVIPSIATAKISSRLVLNQDPIRIGELICQYLKKLAPASIELQTDIHHGGYAFLSAPNEKISTICAQAYEEVFQKHCRKIFSGGTIPIVSELSKVTEAATAIIGVGLDTDDIHAPNEHFSWDQLEKGYLTMGNILRRIVLC